jgi:hypothetical protein
MCRRLRLCSCLVDSRRARRSIRPGQHQGELMELCANISARRHPEYKPAGSVPPPPRFCPAQETMLVSQYGKHGRLRAVDLVNHALVARGLQRRGCGIECQRPDVLVGRTEKIDTGHQAPVDLAGRGLPEVSRGSAASALRQAGRVVQSRPAPPGPTLKMRPSSPCPDRCCPPKVAGARPV